MRFKLSKADVFLRKQTIVYAINIKKHFFVLIHLSLLYRTEIHFISKTLKKRYSMSMGHMSCDNMS